MFENALVGVDGRQGGKDAIALAARLAGKEGMLTLAHVHSGRLRPSRAIAPGMVAEEREAAARLLERERAGSGVMADLVEIESEGPGRALHEQAEEQTADLLVVGSSSRSALGRVTIGATTRAALNGAPCAIAIAAAGYAAHPAIATIGVGYDGSPESKAALAAACELGGATGAEVRAVEVISIPSIAYAGFVSPTAVEDIDTAVKEADEQLRRQLPGVRARAVWGMTGEELAAFGDELDLLAIGSRGYGPIKRLIVGSTANYLERHARCSLLVLPRPALAER